MRKLFDAAWVIGRRDFVATVYSKTFLLFLLGPLLIIAVSIGFGNVAEKMAREDMRASVAIIATDAEFAEIDSARTALKRGFRDGDFPELVHAEPDYSIEAQVRGLLAAKDKRVLAVLSGGVARPKLTGAVSETGSIRRQMALVVEEVRQRRALSAAGVGVAPVEIELVRVEESAGSLASMRAATGRLGQLFLFMLTLMLATMLLSNLVEEKSNKVIEVLAAAVPVDAIFLGKLFSMLVISLVGIGVWVGGAITALALWPLAESFNEPALEWPVFLLLSLIYYSMNYLLLGALFLGLGSQASSIREVQTLSMPVSIAQILLFFFASVAVGQLDSLIGVVAALFPYSSPMVMIARAAQRTELWPHLLAIAWQALWVWLTIKLAASLFRSNVMKSASPGETAMAMLRRKPAAAQAKAGD